MSLTVLTMPANLAGLPALSLPVPGGPAGLPASLQLIGPPGGEERLIALGRMIEAALAANSCPPYQSRQSVEFHGGSVRPGTDIPIRSRLGV